MSTETISLSFNQSVWSNCWTRTLIPSQWELRNGTHGISQNWPELFQITMFLWDWPYCSVTDKMLLLLLRKSKKFAAMLILPKRFWKPLRTQWDKKSVTLILHVWVNFAKRLLRWSISELKFKATWKTEWKSYLRILLNSLVRLLLPNSFPTLAHWAH